MRSLLLLFLLSSPALASDADDAEAALRLAAARRATPSPKISPPPKEVESKPYSYKETTRRVLLGQRVSLAVGVPDLDADGYVGSLPGIAPGVYDCFLNGESPMMTLRPAKVLPTSKVEVPQSPKVELPVTTKGTVVHGVDTLLRRGPGLGSFAVTPQMGNTTMNVPWTGHGGHIDNCPPSG